MTFTGRGNDCCWLIEEEKLERGAEMFQTTITEGRVGLCITRASLDLKDQAIKPKKCLRLSHLIGENQLRPGRLGVLMNIIDNFIDDNDQFVILLEGVDYLVLENKLDKILKLIYMISDKVVERDGVLIISMNPMLFDERDYARLQRDLHVFNEG